MIIQTNNAKNQWTDPKMSAEIKQRLMWHVVNKIEAAHGFCQRKKGMH